MSKTLGNNITLWAEPTGMLTAAAIFCVLIVLILGPQLWTKYVFRRYDTPVPELPGTGGELARHLIERLRLDGCQLAELERGGDHYNPEDRTVYLTTGVYQGKSLTAVAVAAHEIGHVLQHYSHFRPLQLRWQLARYIARTEKLAAFILVCFPFAGLLVKSPAPSLIMLGAGLLILLLPVLFHLVTLPVEWDASFNRALPLLLDGKYLPPSAAPALRRILRAAALTYVAASLSSLLNFYRWIAFLRR